MTTDRFWPLALFFLVAVAAPSGAGAAEKDWKVSASVNYETGTYGTTSTTETFYMPVTLKRYFPEGDLSLTIPYVSQTNGAGLVTIDGSVFQIDGAGGPAQSASGLGDIIFKGSYYLLTEGKRTPFDLNLIAKVKVPAADEAKGLGTGEFDTGLGLEFARSMPSGFTGYFDVYYTAIGDPPGTDLEDRLAFDIGFSRKLAPQWTVSAFYEDSTPLVKPNSHLRDILVSFEFKADDRTRLFFGGTLGLTETSPDYGLSVGASLIL